MSKGLTKEEVIFHKKHAIKEINKLLEKYINHPNTKYLKKANLLSYWLENFSYYISNETSFDPKKLISYKRGDVIKLNFGFNVGSEHGGLHYAIVLDNHNLHSSSVVTVVPLSSGTASTTYKRDVFLGNELYTKLNAKNKILMEKTNEQRDETLKILSAFNSAAKEYKAFGKPSEIPADLLDVMATAKENCEKLLNEIELLEKFEKEISHMKQGSIALMEQITTVSKMRIYVPTKTTDPLYGISVSADSMERINLQLQNLFLKNK